MIKCWDRAVAEMRVSETAAVTCPPDIAYGHRGAGGVIPPDATLLFEILVIDCVGDDPEPTGPTLPIPDDHTDEPSQGEEPDLVPEPEPDHTHDQPAEPE